MNGRKFLLEFLPKEAIGAEIGVWTGGFSERLLDITQPSTLYLIDPWLWDLPVEVPRDCYIASTRLAKSQGDMDKIYKSVVDRLGSKENVQVVRRCSVEAAETFNDEVFDWVYIDGSHDYENVKADLEAWAQKVKVGGYLCGDDFDWGRKYKFPVKRAVNEFLAQETYEHCETKNGQFILRRTE